MQGWIDKVNFEDHYNVAVAVEAGMDVPDVRFLRTMSQEEQDKVMSDPAWDAMSGGMLIEHIDGPECTFHAFHSDDGLSCRVVSVTDPELMAGGQGPDIEDNCTTVFCGRNKNIDLVIDKLLAMALKHDEKYTGFISVSVVFKDNIPRYRKITFGATFKFLLGVLALYDADMKTFFTPELRGERMKVVKGYGATIRQIGRAHV